jgi:hypothetical protein
MSKIQNIDINAKQAKLLKSRAKRRSFIGGRGCGKSMGMGFLEGRLFEEFPRATFAVAGLTYVQLDSIVVPALRKALEKMDYHEYDAKFAPYGVYVIGVQPPKNWIRPYERPGKRIIQYTITFINGFTLRLVSQDNAETHRGLSIDGILVDESATVSFDFIQTVLLPAMRSDVTAPYIGHPWHYGFFDFSSASWTIQGNWIYDTEEKWQEMMEYRAKQIKKHGEQWHFDNPPTHLFLEATFKDNQKFLRPDYESSLRDEMDPWKFNVEVLNQRILKLPDAYYNGFNGEVNLYSKTYDYHSNDKGVMLWNSNDYHVDKPLELSLDFNADICWVLVCQEYSKEFRIIDSQFKKPEVTSQTQQKNLLIQLADWFNDKYSKHEKLDIFIYGDPNGNKRSASTDTTNKVFFDEFCDVLKKAGWRIFRRELTSYPNSKNRYSLVNQLLSESSERFPKIRINQNTNKSFIIARQNTLVKTDKSFSKDKSSERKVRHREYATDPTDAFDYIVWAKYKSLLPNSGWSQTGLIKL